MGANAYTVEWSTPVSVSLSINRLHPDSLSFHESAGDLVQVFLGDNASVELTSSSGATTRIDGATLTNTVAHDIVALRRLQDAPNEAPKTATDSTGSDAGQIFRTPSPGTATPAVSTPISAPPSVPAPHVDDFDVTVINSSRLPHGAPAPTTPTETTQYPISAPNGPAPTAPAPTATPTQAPAPQAAPEPDFDETVFAPDGFRGVAASTTAYLVQLTDSAHTVTHAVAQSLFVGRAPEAPPETGNAYGLAVVASPSEQVSATHLHLRREGSQLLVRDLWSTNGTTLTPPQSAPFRLGPGEELPVLDGTLLNLGDAVTITVLGAHRGS